MPRPETRDQDGWISVSEGLPGPNLVVDVWCGFVVPNAWNISPKGEWMCVEDGDQKRVVAIVTHYRPSDAEA